MAVDKLVDSTQLDSDLTSVANAIRAKSGGSGQLVFPAGFVQVIADIPSEGGGWSAEEIAAGSGPNGEIVLGDNVTTIAAYAFSRKPITKLSATVNGSQSIGVQAFSYCHALTEISLPNWQGTTNANYGNVFQNCASLARVYMPNAWGIPNGMFTSCTALTGIVLPKNTATANMCFSGCSNLTYADLGGNSSSNAGNIQTFLNCTKLSVFIIRSASVRPLGNISTFSGTPFASNGTGGTLYVPQALVSQYTQATNWSTILGYANNQILPIEGSIYETQYADGTPIE